MQLVLTEGYRGLSLMADVMLDRILVPAAVVVALTGAALIGLQLAEMFGPQMGAPYVL